MRARDRALLLTLVREQERERERARVRESESESESERARERERARTRERASEREKRRRPLTLSASVSCPTLVCAHMPDTTDAYDRHGAVLVSDLAMSSVMMGTSPMIVMSHVLVSSWNSVTFACVRSDTTTHGRKAT